MILPIYAYGQSVLRKLAHPIEPDYQNLPGLIEDMFQTMYAARGVGLAAPQIGRDIRLFVVDTLQLEKPEKNFNGFKKVFINAQLMDDVRRNLAKIHTLKAGNIAR